MNERTRDITDADFEVRVLERSKEIPVVIDLWAPWCGPCRTLGPVLEQVAAERPDDFELVKLNVDENPQVAGMLGARSIPLVVAFRDGQPVSAFVGAQPASAVRQFIEELRPGPADRKVAAAEQALSAGEVAQAETLLNEALTLEPRHVDASLLLARLLADGGRFEEALAALKALPSTGHDEVGRLMSEIRTSMSGGGDLDALRAALAANPDDLDAMVELGRALGAAGAYQEALETLLAAVTRSPAHDNGAARQAMLDLFEVLGAAAPETKEFRRKLATALF